MRPRTWSKWSKQPNQWYSFFLPYSWFSGKLGLFLKKNDDYYWRCIHPLFSNPSSRRFPCCTKNPLPGVFKETPLLSGCAAGLGIFFSTAELVGNHPFGLAKKKPFNKMPWRIFGGADQHHFFFWAAQHIPGWILYFSLYLIFFWGVSKVEQFEGSALHTTNKKHIALFFFSPWGNFWPFELQYGCFQK